MAKRVAKKAKPKRRKRETNAERVLREFERRSEFGAAKSFADRIREGMEKNRKGRESEAELPTEWLPTKDEAYLWKILCQPRRSTPRLLRLIADFLDGRPPEDPDNNWFCRAVGAAYGKASSGMPRVASPSDADELLSYPGVSSYGDGVIVALPSFSGFISEAPSFSEFLKVFRKQNPKLKVGDRVLRRALSRLGYETRTENLGRPKKK